jgi:DnaJ family protein C protein 2
MKQEIDRKIKKMKREEMARINLLVERAMAADPRLRREREKERQEKAAKEEVSNIALQSTKEYAL